MNVFRQFRRFKFVIAFLLVAAYLKAKIGHRPQKNHTTYLLDEKMAPDSVGSDAVIVSSTETTITTIGTTTSATTSTTTSSSTLATTKTTTTAAPARTIAPAKRKSWLQIYKNIRESGIDRQLFGEMRSHFISSKTDINNKYETPHFRQYNLGTKTSQLAMCPWLKGMALATENTTSLQR